MQIEPLVEVTVKPQFSWTQCDFSASAFVHQVNQDLGLDDDEGPIEPSHPSRQTTFLPASIAAIIVAYRERFLNPQSHVSTWRLATRHQYTDPVMCQRFPYMIKEEDGRHKSLNPCIVEVTDTELEGERQQHFKLFDSRAVDGGICDVSQLDNFEH